MKVLLICDYNPSSAAMIAEHINSIYSLSTCDIFVYSNLINDRGEIDRRIDLDAFDAIIIHYSIFIAIDDYMSPRSRHRLKKSTSYKIVFLQDEYRFVDNTISACLAAGVSTIYSCVPEHSIRLVYPPDMLQGITVKNTLTGFISPLLTNFAPKKLSKRKWDVSYRGRRYPDWHGRMGREKVEIATLLRPHFRKSRLKTSISTKEKHRVYGDKWITLLRNSKCVLGVESGASVFDYTGAISGATETFRKLLGKNFPYENIKERYFKTFEDKIDLAQISPRVFEAMAVGTVCVLFEGSYSGVIKADIHYISVKKDLSNIASVIAHIKDNEYLAAMAAKAYADVVLNPELSFRRFVANIDDDIVEKVGSPRALPDWVGRKLAKKIEDDRAEKFGRVRALPGWVERIIARGGNESSSGGESISIETSRYDREEFFRSEFNKVSPFLLIKMVHGWPARNWLEASRRINIRRSVKNFITSNIRLS